MAYHVQGQSLHWTCQDTLAAGLSDCLTIYTHEVTETPISEVLEATQLKADSQVLTKESLAVKRSQ